MLLKSHGKSCDSYCNELFCNKCPNCKKISDIFSQTYHKLFITCSNYSECFCCLFFTIIYCIITAVCCTIVVWLFMTIINHNLLNFMTTTPLVMPIFICGICVIVCICSIFCCWSSCDGNGSSNSSYLLIKI